MQNTFKMHNSEFNIGMLTALKMFNNRLSSSVLRIVGCGKSTLAKLLLGFLQPQEGNIKLDGKDIRYLTANELRNFFGVVPQETTLFSGTLYENEPFRRVSV